MPGSREALVSTLIVCSALLCALPLYAHAAQTSPIGAWRTTNGCFLSAFILNEGGSAQAVYLSGERDDYAGWTGEGDRLEIISEDFPLDSFSGRVISDEIEADYVWHDIDQDAYNPQSCVFERFIPPGN